VSGRLVRRLIDAPLPRGAHRLGWDGRNDGGASVASGVYLYRVEAGSFVASGRLVRIR